MTNATEIYYPKQLEEREIEAFSTDASLTKVMESVLTEVIISDNDLMFMDSEQGALVVEKKGDFLKFDPRDCLSISREYRISGAAHADLICIRANRNSIYDKLPEVLFLRPQLGRHNSTHIEIVEEMKELKKTDEQLRKFFVPIDTEYVLQLARYVKDMKEWPFSLDNEAFKKFSSFFDDAAIEGINYFAYLHGFKSVFRLKNRPDAIGRFLSELFRRPIEVLCLTTKITEVPTALMGGCRLGVDSVIGEEIMDETTDYEVHVQVDKPTFFLDTQEKARFRTSILRLMDFMVNAAASITVVFSAGSESCSNMLDNSILGENLAL
jgi:hypothetical protein